MFGSALLACACGARSALELGFDNDGSSDSGGTSGMGFAQPTAGSPAPLAGASGASPEAAFAGSSAGAPALPTVAKAINAGTETSCGMRENGTVWCWGANENGQLGDGTTTYSALPVQVLGIDSAIAIASGGTWTAGGKGAANSSFNCALLRGGSVRCWGRVPDTVGSQPVPLLVPGIDHAVAVAAGNWHACALLEGGSVQCWGDNSRGQLGNGSSTNGGKRFPVLGISSATAIVGAGSDFTCAALAGGSVECWGEYFEAVARGSTIPVTIAIQGVTPSGIAAGYTGACAVLPDGSVQCWSGVDTSAPVPVPGVHSAKTVTMGLSHACALLSDGTIQCWVKISTVSSATRAPSRSPFRASTTRWPFPQGISTPARC
ncbi:MAG TPA: hypothetical protein VGJ91_19890 [Polyangiaceae bacterium]